jgi:hypothetical protein
VALTPPATNARHDAVLKIALMGWLGTGEFFTVSLQWVGNFFARGVVFSALNTLLY